MVADQVNNMHQEMQNVIIIEPKKLYNEDQEEIEHIFFTELFH